MSGDLPVSRYVEEESIHWQKYSEKLFSAAFGDRYGYSLFLAVISVTLPLISLGFVINDNMTIANALAALGDGSLAVKEAQYGASLDTPGMVETGGNIYGRNYGHVFLALPVLLLLRGIASVADVLVVIAGVWALCLYWVVRNVFVRFGYEYQGTLLGGVIALSAFLASVSLAPELEEVWYPYLALCFVSIVAGGFIAVLLYRLLVQTHDRKVALGIGLAAVLGTPITLWAPIPKRHVLLGCLAVCSLFLLAASRRADEQQAIDRYRALSYAPIGISAWVSAPDGVILGLAVVIADFTTAERTTRHSLAMIGVVSIVSFLPFALTNVGLSGSPLTPPRLLPDYGSSPESLNRNNPTPGADFVPVWLRVTPVWRIASQFLTGGAIFATQPERVVDVLVRSQVNLPTPGSVVANDGINLSVVESVPLVAPIAGFTVLIGTRIRQRDISVSTEGAFAAAYTVLITLAYLPRLPVYATVTVRYLVPMYPLLIYAVARLPAVRRAIEHRWRWGAWTYAGTVLIGGQLFLAGVTLLERGTGESMQTHAIVNLAIATFLALWAVAATLATRSEAPDSYDTVGAILLGLAAGAGTVLVLLATIAYFPVGDFLLPIVPSL
jgi:hypothetical protein